MNKEDLLKLKKKISALTPDERYEREKYLRSLAKGEIQGPPTEYPSINMTQLKYYDTAFNENDIPNKSMYQHALDSNKDNMDKVALDLRGSFNDFEEIKKITYRELFELIDMNAKSSKVLGIKEDEIVPIILPNIFEARTLIYSTNKIGATSYPISPMLPTNVLENIIKQNKVHNIFIFAPFYYKFYEAFKSNEIKNIIVLGENQSIKETFKDDRIISWNEYCDLSKRYSEEIIPYYNKNHIAVIIGTSGTTGTSKGVCLSDKNINAYVESDIKGKFFEGTFMDALMPSIGYGISMVHYETVSGTTVYLISELLTDKFPRALEKLKPDNFPGGPVHYINLLNSDLFKEGRVEKGKNYISGGASLPKIVESTLNNLAEGYKENGTINRDIIVRQGIGMTETAGSGAYNKKGAYAFGSVGITSPYIKSGVFIPGTDEELPYGEEGELCFCSPITMEKYLNNIKETENVIKIHSDGTRWIHTGDVVIIDENGHIFHKDRIKNIFMRTGFNVHPSKISEFINTIPFVKNSTVIGFEHPEEQCVPIAFIILNEEKTKDKSDEEIKQELSDYCYTNLEETSIPYDFVFVNDLPINVGGKIDIQKIKKESGIDLTKSKEKIKKRIKF